MIMMGKLFSRMTFPCTMTVTSSAIQSFEMLEDADERSSCALNVKSDGLLNIIQDVPHGTRDTCRQLFYLICRYRKQFSI